ncbi:MAG: hypothetical protein M8353_04330 [ANME-2 cluster archaeon]|nr:hypothetical protein [ANME-2 cluster archaeon]
MSKMLTNLMSNTWTMQDIHVIAHCLLNPSVRLKGLKPPERPDLSDTIIQLPCPEFIFLGPKRWEMTKEQLDIPKYRRFCRQVFQPTADTIEMLYHSGHPITLVGIPGSPSCGALTTSTGMEGGRLREAEHTHIQCSGIFFEEIIRELEQREIKFNMMDLNIIH